MLRWQFKPAVWPSIATLVFFVLTLMLGNWQLHRAAEKYGLQQQYEKLHRLPPVTLNINTVTPEHYQYQKVEVSGEYLAAKQIYLDNKIYQGKAGYEVVTPLRILRSERYILVNRGWMVRGENRNQPEAAVPAGLVQIEGIAVTPTKKFIELSAATVEGTVWQNLVIERYRQATGLDVLPVIIEQQNNTSDKLVRDWPRPDFGIDKHRAYALQWFLLALLILGLYIGLNLKRVHPETK